MDSRGAFLLDSFLSGLPYEPTSCQRDLLARVALFLTGDDGDIMVVNGYAGTGKTSAIASVIGTMSALEVPCVISDTITF